MADVARELNVSQATVSYVLNGRGGNLVGERTRERVLQMAQQMGYRPNRAAQSLAGKSSNVIELCINSFSPAYYAQVLQAFYLQMASTTYQLHVVNPSNTSEKEWDSVGSDWPMDGLIIADTHVPDSAISTLIQSGVPVVAAGIYARTYIDQVQVDVASAVSEAVHHMASRGKRVAYVSLWPAEHFASNVDPRYPAYNRVMREFGLQEELIVTSETPGIPLRQSTRALVRDYIIHNGAPDGIFCFNDERAIGTLAALRDLSLKVPEDVMLIGCDGIEETAYHSPSISTIQYPYDEMARLTWEFLRYRIEEPNAPLKNTTLTAELVLRDSSAH